MPPAGGAELSAPSASRAAPRIAHQAAPGEPILRVENLSTHFNTDGGLVRAVDGVSFHVNYGETLAIVGESGSGKSVTAMSILRLLAMPPARIASGRIWYQSVDLLSLSAAEMRAIRGNNISMVFQEPMTSLDPVMTVGRQVAESFQLHRDASRREAMGMAIEALDLVGIPEPARRAREYPFELSGGMRQRVMIAMAMSCNPKLLIADEPTTALDVTIQAQILALMNDLKARMGTSIILITHDLGVVAEMAQRVIVMYAGRVVEESPLDTLFDRPLHPYTLGLLGSVPQLYSSLESDGGDDRLTEMPGNVPSPLQKIAGCPFEPRCRFATERCRQEMPPLEHDRNGHHVACWESETVGASHG